MISRSEFPLWEVLDLLALAGLLCSAGVALLAVWREKYGKRPPPPKQREPMQCWGGPRDGFTCEVDLAQQYLEFPVLLGPPKASYHVPTDSVRITEPKIGRLRYIRWGRRADGVALFRPER